MTTFRFREDENLQDIYDYIAGTYGQHYANEVNGKNVQVIDLWDAQGSLLTTARDTAQKYLARFGRKDGFNPKDAFKAVHYILLMLYAAQNQQHEETSPTDDTVTDYIDNDDSTAEQDTQAYNEEALNNFGEVRSFRNLDELFNHLVSRGLYGANADTDDSRPGLGERWG